MIPFPWLNTDNQKSTIFCFMRCSSPFRNISISIVLFPDCFSLRIQFKNCNIQIIRIFAFRNSDITYKNKISSFPGSIKCAGRAISPERSADQVRLKG